METKLILKVPYHSQRDNEFYPSNTCNITCVAMVLAFFGINSKLKPQLEDELFLKVQEKGWDRYTHDDLDKLFELYGIENEFTTEATWERIKAHLDNGNPVIISGKFTKSGHIIVLRGYDQKGFFVNDPWGEWFATGYQNKSGENLHYSYKLLYNVSYGGSKTCWAHFPMKKKTDPASKTLSNKLPLPGVQLIKEFEGCYLNAYPDPLSGGKPITIGWGATKKQNGGEWKLGDRISQDGADNLLILQLERDYLPPLQKIPCWKDLNENQQGALLSFAYNLGANFYESPGFASITNMLKSKNWRSAMETFVKYRNPGTSVEQGLKRRRLAEAELFLKPLG
jgi:GH24 family phage-related lysozyme (muramidase)